MISLKNTLNAIATSISNLTTSKADKWQLIATTTSSNSASVNLNNYAELMIVTKFTIGTNLARAMSSIIPLRSELMSGTEFVEIMPGGGGSYSANITGVTYSIKTTQVGLVWAYCNQNAFTSSARTWWYAR